MQWPPAFTCIVTPMPRILPPAGCVDILVGIPRRILLCLTLDRHRLKSVLTAS